MEFAKKKFGQNFITDRNLIKKIISILDPEPNQLVIEIGPGRGALTKELVQNFKKVVAIEIDKDMEALLKTEINSDNFELITQDVLQVNLKELISSEYKKISLISNTPYYITSEIIFRAFDLAKDLDKAVFMVQKEVAQRICAKQNENNYNNLSVAAQFYSDVKYELTVSKNMFRPVPKVDSAVITLTFKNQNLIKVNDDKEFIAFVRKLFNNKRKTILNNLSSVLGDKTKSLTILEDLKIATNLRPENISLEDFIKIYKEVQNEN
ncbi:dimethyladenosine transferase [Spiroplasma clarkii]|uniref:Ribosomal RNA small subunit methyltransferase A n=1 Tax=Spiroplasma clarkii TaxID=2139 RepID=A0A1Y0KYS7_9MOLU|nr:16S rRNA (adenine(1518)-N(6)/adenine(1519)-N(6))-dimethyltransferase RsmA [Spiroplasma clarkii]ARU90883.1 dimethyladenosine transferase [Spiroplasma clarkii]ATX71672.1 dimethyladenosine transferase [Spiroplasma clarkii]